MKKAAPAQAAAQSLPGIDLSHAGANMRRGGGALAAPPSDEAVAAAAAGAPGRFGPLAAKPAAAAPVTLAPRAAGDTSVGRWAKGCGPERMLIVAQFVVVLYVSAEESSAQLASRPDS